MALRLIQCYLEYRLRSKSEISSVGSERRGIYILYKKEPRRRKKKPYYNVLYIGMTDSSVRVRLRSHNRKKTDWTHFSVYAVWPNVTKEEIRELEGLFRHIYRDDSQANVFNRQRKFKALGNIRAQNANEWKDRTGYKF